MTNVISQLRAEVARSEFLKRAIETDHRVDITGASFEARALILAALHERTHKRLAIIAPGDAAIDDFEAALKLFHTDPRCVSTYPSPSLSPYQDIGPALGVVREEVRALGMLIEQRADVLIVPVRALFSRLPRPETFAARMVTLAENEEIDVQQVLQTLVENGFVRTDLVGEAGEFAFRGGILDVFPPNSEKPLRVELFGDTIDSLRWFDPESQRSDDPAPPLTILPMSHFPLSREVRNALARRLSLDFNHPIYKRDVAEKIERLQENGTFPGIEHYVHAAVDSVSFAEYLRDWTVVLVEPDGITSSTAKYESILRSEFEAASEKGRAVYQPEKLVTPGVEILSFAGSARLALSEVHIASKEFDELRVHAPQTDRYTNRLPEFTTDVQRARDDNKHQVFFAATKGGVEKTERLLKEFNVAPDVVTIASGHLARGFSFDEINLVAWSEWDLFEPPTSSGRLGSRRRKSEAFVTDLRDLKVGDLIVHVDHGVGRFLGLQRIPFGETEREVMEIEYSGGGKLLMPMENLNLIQKYSGGGEEAKPQLDKLGGTSWARKKASVKKAMRDMADELLKLYATRQMVQGHAFSKDSPWQFEFEEAFEFDETD
ncbi:MAG TPA: CarD family transcriptional regulator, partial [Thermoanaerobaculia bacterium]|nr:CarD family transcriptional regulator [Thermoanaerobaculia bacterium]